MQMTAESSAGAVSHLSTDWHSIPWRTVNENVRRLQARIVQATKAGKWHKVQALQHMLTHSVSGKALAVRESIQSSGKTRKPKGWPYTRCSNADTNRDRCDACISRNPTGKNVLWVSRQ